MQKTADRSNNHTSENNSVIRALPDFTIGNDGVILGN